MATFIEGDQLNTALTDMIANADKFLWFISPYIKLNERTKFNLKQLKNKPDTQIVIVFGKNENDLSKSVSLEDLTFFKEFPNVIIKHVPSLHAKFYVSEDYGIITSMNLYEFSQVNNVEAGVILEPEHTLKKLTNIARPNTFDGAFERGIQFFERVIDQAQLLYHRQPLYKKTVFGLSEKYDRSETVTDDLDKYYKAGASKLFESGFNSSNLSQPTRTMVEGFRPEMGYCIRSGVEIPFKRSRPYCLDSYRSWAEFENWDYAENFCHKTGKPTYGKTSMRNPVLL